MLPHLARATPGYPHKTQIARTVPRRQHAPACWLGPSFEALLCSVMLRSEAMNFCLPSFDSKRISYPLQDLVWLDFASTPGSNGSLLVAWGRVNLLLLLSKREGKRVGFCARPPKVGCLPYQGVSLWCQRSLSPSFSWRKISDGGLWKRACEWM